MFLTIKRKSLLLFLCLVFCVTSAGVYFGTAFQANRPSSKTTIVIDAGHGGKDGGAVGKNSTESYLNLQYSFSLKKLCEQFGFKVVLTRSDMNGLYSPFATNKKKSEMEKRKSIIEKAKPDIVVSIHMNSSPSTKARGAQVFYAAGAESGLALAKSVQETLHKNIDYAKLTPQVGDFFILNCTENPSILVECGFISNLAEEQLLIEEEYREKFCYNLFCGILMYFGFN